jgi:hypothetical protein
MQHQATTSSLLGKALQVIQLPKRNQTKNANCGKQAQMVSNSLGFGNPFQNILLRKKTDFTELHLPISTFFPASSQPEQRQKHVQTPGLPIHSLFKTTIFLCKISIWLRQLATPNSNGYVCIIPIYSMIQWPFSLGIPKFQTHPLVTPKLPKPHAVLGLWPL